MPLRYVLCRQFPCSLKCASHVCRLKAHVAGVCVRCVIPVRVAGSSGQELKPPFGLTALKGIDGSKIMSNGRSLIECCADENWRPDKSDIDPLFLENMSHMLNDRLWLKLAREDSQKKELRKWIREEQVRRCVKREQEMVEAEQQRRWLEQIYHEQRHQLHTQSKHYVYTPQLTTQVSLRYCRTLTNTINIHGPITLQ